MLATPNHPIWVIGYVDSMYQTIFYPNPFWKRIDELIYGELITNSDGNLLQVVNAQPVYKFNNPSIENNNDFYWVQDNYHQSFEDYWHGDIDPDYWQTEAEFKADGKAYDINYYINKGFVVGGLVQDDHQNVGFTNSLVDKHGDYIPFTRNVYNIEVADNHTYFVGYNGVWVHNKNCELVGFNEGTPLSDIVSNDRTVVKPGGDAMYSEIVKRAKNNTQSVSMACFVAGTLVHTDKGLVPIEQIKVGDMVLSRPENGEGEATYKRVTNTFITENQPIWAMEILGDSEEECEYLFVTENHPIWRLDSNILDYSKGRWTKVSEISDHNDVIGGTDNRGLIAFNNYPLMRSKENEKVFFQIYAEYDAGVLLDLNEYKQGKLKVIETIYGDEHNTINNEDENGCLITLPFIDTVYNIEVEDYHTYYVGRNGIWVRDKS